MGEAGERDSDVQVVVDEATIEISETEEGLNVFNLPRLRPFANDFDFVVGHCQAFSFQDIAEEFYRILVPFAFIGFRKRLFCQSR